MLARVTYGLVVAALIALLLGIFVLDSTNAMLFVSIGLSIACIGLVIFGAARRARETPDAIVAPDPDFATIDADADEDEDSTAVLSAFEDAEDFVEDDEEEVEEEDDDEFFEDEDDEDDEEEDDEDTEVIAVPARRPSKSTSKPAAKKSTRKTPAKATARKAAASKPASKAKSAAKPKSTAKAKTTAKSAGKSKATASKSSGGKVVVVPGRDRYHKSSCRFVKGKDDIETITLAAAKRGGYEPCSVCDPS